MYTRAIGIPSRPLCKNKTSQVVQVTLNQPMAKIREILGGYSVRTRLSLTGTLVVARDIAHAKLQERIDAGKGLPDYVKDHIIYYAGGACRLFLLAFFRLLLRGAIVNRTCRTQKNLYI